MLGTYVTKSADWYSVWGSPCQAVATSASVTIYGKAHKCHPAAVAPFQVWEQIRAKHGYAMDGTDTGIYNCRHMRHDPAAPMSVHSWGMALDANWLQNPAGSKLVTDMPRAMINEILSLKTASGAWVFRWLGDIDRDGISTDQTYIDAMHFEVMAHPLDLKTGISYGSVTVVTTPPVQEDFAAMLPVIDLSKVTTLSTTFVRSPQNHIKILQGLLMAHWLLTPAKPDGIAGPATRAAVIQFQSVKGLTPDAIVGKATWKALLQI
jgi:hypothetical protein